MEAGSRPPALSGGTSAARCCRCSFKNKQEDCVKVVLKP
ncbi:hypothetical protein GA0074696_2692 [Micromonospora purpureochromogenes]|uniref:Uncharacterized protein n=1 Tax=Micromonospora purpureochromogenes TaxID=47872 RepID=A0A1C4XM55_9ACTN|nr:hypothetical protein GA0074696_2692 [Micromonospora purpureochromogenes]